MWTFQWFDLPLKWFTFVSERKVKNSPVAFLHDQHLMNIQRVVWGSLAPSFKFKIFKFSKWKRLNPPTGWSDANSLCWALNIELRRAVATCLGAWNCSIRHSHGAPIQSNSPNEISDRAHTSAARCPSGQPKIKCPSLTFPPASSVPLRLFTRILCKFFRIQIPPSSHKKKFLFKWLVLCTDRILSLTVSFARSAQMFW